MGIGEGVTPRDPARLERSAEMKLNRTHVFVATVWSRGNRNVRGRSSRIARVRSHADEPRHGELRPHGPSEQRPGQVPDKGSDRRPYPEARLRCEQLLRLASPPGHDSRVCGVGCGDPLEFRLQLDDVRAGPSEWCRVRRGRRRPAAGHERWGGATVYVTFVAPNADPPVFRIEDTTLACP